jgi:hypothetical protein
MRHLMEARKEGGSKWLDSSWSLECAAKTGQKGRSSSPQSSNRAALPCSPFCCSRLFPASLRRRWGVDGGGVRRGRTVPGLAPLSVTQVEQMVQLFPTQCLDKELHKGLVDLKDILTTRVQ